MDELYKIENNGLKYAIKPDGTKYYEEDLIKKPLWYHLRGLMQTASGYGRAIKTEYVLKHNNRIKRVYCSIFSNSGILYIKSNGVDLYLNIN